MMGEDDESPGTYAPTEEDEALESGDISILNSLVGHRSPRCLQLWGTVGKVSGETLLCESVCAYVPIRLQGLSMEVDLYVLPMQGPDVVLGLQWLQKLGKVTHDYVQQTMEFTLANKTYSLQGDESLRMKRISLHHMQALLETNDVYEIYELYNLSAKEHNNGAASNAKIVEAIYKWRQCLVGRQFIVRTDHKSIKELMQQVIQTPFQQKYVRKLIGFDFVIEYKPGASNQATDALSRVFKEEEVTATFIAISQPMVRLTPLLHEFHNTPSAGHSRSKKMLVGLSALFYLKGMRKWTFTTFANATRGVGRCIHRFVTGLPPSKGLAVILVVVDRFSKYAHFGALPTNFNAHTIAEVFMDIVVKHHGIPKMIVLDRDPIFVSKFRKQLFQFSGTQLNRSTAYHGCGCRKGLLQEVLQLPRQST
nr:hypothetical protein [Tanacetum cinerariifolium]